MIMIRGMLFHLGQYMIMMRSALSRPNKLSMYWKETVRQMYDIGVGSLIIVMLIAVFIGAVSAVQFAYQIGGVVPNYYIGYVVRDLTIIELAPTITCLVLAGKVGSNMAAEIGGMRQKEHIDAMEVMGVNTAAYLITPKVIAALVMIPILVAAAAWLAVMGGYVASVPAGLITNAEYVQGVRAFFEPYFVFMMFVKAFVFAFLLTTVSCYQGYFVTGGAVELGQASTRAVVVSDILILLADYVIAIIMTT